MKVFWSPFCPSLRTDLGCIGGPLGGAGCPKIGRWRCFGWHSALFKSIKMWIYRQKDPFWHMFVFPDAPLAALAVLSVAVASLAAPVELTGVTYEATYATHSICIYIYTYTQIKPKFSPKPDGSG